MRRLGLAAATLAASGCLPDRDNLHDPQNRPSAVLTVLSADVERDALGHPTTPETCSATTSSYPSGGASRGLCLLASSAGSEARSGSGFTPEFRVSWVTSNGALSEVPMSSADAATGELQPSEIRALALPWTPDAFQADLSTAKLRVHLEITDDRGAVSEASEDILVTNTSPIAKKRGHITVPVYGALWQLPADDETVLDLHLDGGSSSDADGDPLAYCWSGSSVTSPACNIEDPFDAAAAPWQSTPQGLATLTFPAEPNSTDAKLRVFDGVELSEKAGAGIVLATIPTWGVDKSGNAVLLDLNRRTSAIPSSGAVDDPLPGGAFFPNVGTWPDRLVAPIGAGDQVRAWAVGSTAAGPVLVLPANQRVVAMEADSDRGLTWAAVAEDLGALAPTLRVYALEFDPPESTTLVVRDDWAPMIPAPILGTRPALATEGSGTLSSGTTDLWIAPQFGDHAWALRFDHATNAILEIRDFAVPAGRMITAVDLRKGDQGSEAVIVDAVDALAGGATGQPAFTAIPRGTGDWPQEFPGLFELPGVEMDGLQPWGLRFYSRTPGAETSAWTNLFGVGLASLYVRIDGVVPVLALDVLAPTSQTGFDLSVNEGSGRVLLLHGGRQGFTRALRDGSVTEVETVSRILGVWADKPIAGEPRIGSVWTLLDREGAISPRIAIGEGSGSEGFLTRAPVFPGYGAYTIDYSSGDLWVGSVVPSGLARVQIDGTVTDFVVALDEDSSPADAVHPPPAIFLAGEPEGGTIWTLAASDPTYGAADLFYRFDPNAIRTDVQVGLVVPGLEFPPVANGMLGLGGAPDEYALRAFAIPATNELVVVTFENFSGAYHLRRIDGTTGQLVGSDVAVSATATSAAASRDLIDGGICGASVVPGAPTQLRLARYDSALVQQYAMVVTGGFLSVLSSASANEECWTGVQTVAGNQVLLWRPGSLPFGVAGGGITSPRHLLAFLDPSLKNPPGSPSFFQSQAWISGDSQMMRLVVDTSGGSSVLRVDEIIDTTSEVLLVQP